MDKFIFFVRFDLLYSCKRHSILSVFLFKLQCLALNVNQNLESNQQLKLMVIGFYYGTQIHTYIFHGIRAPDRIS